jgi:glutamate-ammonia-ligase adenylyltransferase
MAAPIKPGFREIKQRLPDINDRDISEHLAGLPSLYFEKFGPDTICLHILNLSRLSKKNPVHLLSRVLPEGLIECTVLSFDYPAVFSLITGVLSSYGFRFISGDIFTYRRAGRSGTPKTSEFFRRKIIDQFRGQLDSERPFDIWIAEVEYQLKAVLSALETRSKSALSWAKQKVNEMAAVNLNRQGLPAAEALSPIRMEITNRDAEYTRLHIVSEDTPFFLYTLSTALSLHNISIELVRIETRQNTIEDDFYISDLKGNKITDQAMLDKVRLSVLLTKQFSFFLGSAPDPYSALCRFETMVSDITGLPEKGKWYDLLGDHLILDELAHLLGTSDFLWEDFIRNQYETLLPMLSSQIKGRRFSGPPSEISKRLAAALKNARSLEEKKAGLNRFKDHEIYLIDLDHILSPHATIKDLSLKLTALAEAVINRAFDIIYAECVKKYGRPRSVAGLEAAYALFGLGKLGGRALGYASDIELLFIYSDNGATDGAHRVANAEFFEQLMRDAVLFIQAKRQGIFQIDTRLRPFGKAGSLACSLENFCRYYGPGGKAHAAERLALVRLRKIGGNAETGSMVERLRDEMIYESTTINPAEVFRLRQKQYALSPDKQRFNVKFGPGGLVDLEYTVQLLQVIHGNALPALRTPLLHNALRELARARVLHSDEADRLTRAYYFFRKVINGLRMLRGSAQDLLLPAGDSGELMHLARRIGYEYKEDLSPQQQLLYELETCTARTRLFVEQYFGRNYLPGKETGNIADLVLSRELSPGLRTRVLEKTGLKQTERAYTNLVKLAGTGRVLEGFTGIVVIAGDILSRKPDPDMALNNWERFVRALQNPLPHYRLLLSQPRRLDILLTIFSVSHFLSDTLIRHPDFFEDATHPDSLLAIREQGELTAELSEVSRTTPDGEKWQPALCRFRKKETLRIAIKDICLDKPLTEIVLELSRLAQAVIEAALSRIWAGLSGSMQKLSRSFCVLAFGKLGGFELNYSSDIDLLALYDDTAAVPENAADIFSQVFEQLIHTLEQHTAEGYVYRVDVRLRPFGKAGPLVPTITSLVDYYRQKAGLWEIQALLKLRPVAGNLSLGSRFLKTIRPLLLTGARISLITSSISAMRKKALAGLPAGRLSYLNVKIGMGGIRDIEFMVQGLQRIHAAAHPEILHGNTLTSLDLLYKAGILDMDKTRQLERDYIFLRRIEHYLQLLEDRQTYELPAQASERAVLAKRVLGIHSSAEALERELNACLARVRDEYERFLGGGNEDEPSAATMTPPTPG